MRPYRLPDELFSEEVDPLDLYLYAHDRQTEIFYKKGGRIKRSVPKSRRISCPNKDRRKMLMNSKFNVSDGLKEFFRC